MADIQSATAEIRRGKKKKKEEERRKKKPQDENIMSASATQGGHNEGSHSFTDLHPHVYPQVHEPSCLY